MESARAVFHFLIPKYRMPKSFRQYVLQRDLQEGLWMPDKNAVEGLSKMPEPKPAALKPVKLKPGPLKPAKFGVRPPQPFRPFKPKPIAPPGGE